MGKNKKQQITGIGTINGDVTGVVIVGGTAPIHLGTGKQINDPVFTGNNTDITVSLGKAKDTEREEPRD